MFARTLQKGSLKSSGGTLSAPIGNAKGMARQITVYLVPATSNTRTDASRMLGNATRAFPEDTPMEDVMTHLLRHWNLDWEKDSAESLTPEHISLRLFGNVGIQPHSTAGSLGNFFSIHDRIYGNNPKKMLQGPPTLKLPSPAIYLEGLILVKEYEDQTGAQAPYFVHTEKEIRKRKLSATTGNVTSVVKRTRSQLPSHVFTPLRSEIGDLPGFSKVLFLFATVSVARDGAVNIIWPDFTATPVACTLQDTPLGQGKTKKVFKAIYDGMPWVAKRFFDIGTGEEQVEIHENSKFLIQEITRLAKSGYYLEHFVAEAKQRGVSIDETISVTDFKLGIEVVQDGASPSLASGVSLDRYQDANTNSNSKLLWLFEPRRSARVDHWSGTNDYPAWHHKKLGSTLNAFTHYVYHLTQESIVLADLQTSTAVNEHGDGLNVLFDMMTHTSNGASGVGDHGQEGIDTFVQSHECVDRCDGLGLSKEGFTKALKESGESDEEEED
ncbi:kinase-like domain-containing protein [Favolaschia claudopus]|uniref:Kinase-like domain-containing protein n=1 Tax=Favolaschia claudopus TaxID=2862362 RepID=A0AAW0AN98_9AGAR